MDDTDPSKKTHHGLRLLVLFLLLTAAFAWYMHFVSSPQGSLQPVYDNGVFEARLQNLENSTALYGKRIDRLEENAQKQVAASASPAPSPTPAPAQAAATAPSDQEARIAALEKEIATLKSAAGTESNEQLSQAIRLLSAFHRFSDRVLSGKPFAGELSAFADLTSDNDVVTKALSALAPYADSGIPTFAQLLASFDAALDQLNAMEATPPPGATAWQRFVYNIEHLVRIRKLSEDQTGKGVDATVARASSHLDREEIEAAMAEIKSLPDAQRSAFSGWLDDAQTASDAPVLIDQIEEQVMLKAFRSEGTPPATSPLLTPKDK